MRLLLIYHFFYPDTVVSARIMADFAEEMAKAGNRVTVYTSNRLIRKTDRLCAHEVWNGVEIRRFSRPRFSQGKNVGRVINSLILQIKWLTGFLFERKKYDAVIIGTDPQFVWLMFPYFKLIGRRIKLIHWCFDLYPEAIMVNCSALLIKLASMTRPFAFLCYRACDVFADIGPCMRKRLEKYRPDAEYHTLTPWALKEPDSIPEPDPRIRKELFGDAKIGLLYSGTVGYAHDLKPFIDFARECRRQGVDAAFCFAGYGNCYDKQVSMITEEDTNIRLAGFASEEDLEKRLAAADIHMISLRKGWEGIVVPSKFFGALAIGRPVVFSGPRGSAICSWCTEYNVGKHLDEDMLQFLKRIEDREIDLETWKRNAYDVYQKEFSKKVVCEKWERLLAGEKEK